MSESRVLKESFFGSWPNVPDRTRSVSAMAMCKQIGVVREILANHVLRVSPDGSQMLTELSVKVRLPRQTCIGTPPIGEDKIRVQRILIAAAARLRRACLSAPDQSPRDE